MAVLTRRDVRGLRAQARRYAHQHGCDEVHSLIKHCERLGAVDPTRLPPPTVAWITEAYVALLHEIATLRREYRAAGGDREGAPAVSQTVAGASFGQLLAILTALDEHPIDYGLPPGGIWTFQVTRLHDAWHGSLHTERYQLDLWGPPPLVERVFGIVQHELFP